MEQLYERFINLPKTTQFLEIVKNKIRLINKSNPLVSVQGLAGAKSLLALSIFRTFNLNLIYLANNEENKKYLHSDLVSFLPEEKIIMFENNESAEIECYRLFNSQEPFIIILQSADLNITLPEKDQWHKHRLIISKGMKLSREYLIDWLISAQYERLDLVSEPNEYAVRGGIVDVFSLKSLNPIRIEFFNDEVISLRYFDTITQRSIGLISEVTLQAQRSPDAKKNTMDNLMPKDSIVLSENTCNRFSNLIFITEKASDFNFGFTAPSIYFGNFNLLKSEIESLPIEYIFVVSREYQYQRLTHIFDTKPTYLLGNLHLGIFAPDDGFCVITEKELYGTPIIRLPKRRFKGQPLDDLLALNKGDYVVHIDYGIGQFDDVVRLKVEDIEKDFLLIHYANNQKLYVPVENLGLIERYIGEENKPPTLSVLGSKRWLLTKAKVARATEQYTQELLKIYAERSVVHKKPISKDTDWQEQFEAAFPYEETPDQIKALADVKRDLESPKPMERLICGDTGFGKTEIALRATFKTVMDLKQVAILVPTTILCYQHYHTFLKRFKNFPIRIEMLSRFTSKNKQEKIIADLKTGKVDIAIGTHILLNSDIEFKDLGLLVIDEEHKFGVRQKEKIKKLKATVDVLTLTATPIPRSLYRALVGITDISSINTPPPGRRDIITNVIYWDDEIIFQKINDELKRGGQVLFIHNRIDSIKNIAKRLHDLNRNWKIAVAHSKLPEKCLADIYLEFLNNKYDILVSTAIIESGLDMPNVNTIIVNRADQFGLSDLHQLRGRVGRSDKQAYAIFILPEEKKLKRPRNIAQVYSEQYQKRLATILAYSQLGSGFRIAMRDMELRGVGNILGPQQHGYIAQVGLSLYQQMLKDAIARLRGETIKSEPILSIDVPAYIPEHYITDSYERVAIYKRLLSLESEEELKTISEELQDRFGKYPEVIKNLFAIALIRLKARELFILKVTLKNNVITIVKEGKTITFNGNFDTLQKTLAHHL